MRKTSAGMNRLPCARSFLASFVSAKAANVSVRNRATMTTAAPQINVKQSISEVFLLCLRRVNHGVTSKALSETPGELNFQVGLIKRFILSY